MTDRSQLGDSDVLPIVKEMVFEGVMLPAAIYIRMAKDRYVIIGKRGELARIQQMTNYHHPSFKLYVLKEDFSDFVSYLSVLAQKVVHAEKLNPAQKGSVVQSLVEVALRDLDSREFAEIESLRLASEYVRELHSQIENFDQFDAIVSSLPETEAKHSMIVCLVSLLILREMQAATKQAEEHLALGALLHNVGLRYVPEEIMVKPSHLRSREEIDIYESHPIRGVDCLRDLKSISNEVLFIVAEHHELANGTGYPKRMRDLKMSPLSRIVSLANAFAELIYNPKGREFAPDEAIQHLQDVMGMPFNRGVFSALKNIINRRYLQGRRKSVA